MKLARRLHFKGNFESRAWQEYCSIVIRNAGSGKDIKILIQLKKSTNYFST